MKTQYLILLWLMLLGCFLIAGGCTSSKSRDVPDSSIEELAEEDGGMQDESIPAEADSTTDAAESIDDYFVETAAIVPTAGTASFQAISCTGAYPLPDAFTGPKGLGAFGWTLSDLTNTMSWGLPSKFDTVWISEKYNVHPSLKVRPQLIPEAGSCYLALLKNCAAGPGKLTCVLQAMSAFGNRNAYYDALKKELYAPSTYNLESEDVLVGSLRGLYQKANVLPNAPVVAPWSRELNQSLLSATASYPQPVKKALAWLVLSIGEAYDFKIEAMADGDMNKLQQIHTAFLSQSYFPVSVLTDALMAPVSSISLILEVGHQVDLSRFYLAAEAVSMAAEHAREVLSAQQPFESTAIDLLTPHGRIIIRTSNQSDTYPAQLLADACLVVDLEGNDRYEGRYASTHKFWMGASVALDVRGNDIYNPGQADISDSATSYQDAFKVDNAFTQGFGLFGVGLLLDGAGDDLYRASVFAQGSGDFGVGILADSAGNDTYQTTLAGQGTGTFGLGLLLDESGDDDYGVYMIGQGVGRPSGHGLLLDLSGSDDYIGYYNDDPPELPSPGFKNFYARPSGYDDSEGHRHVLSFTQGVGFGYRADWFSPQVHLSGGFGALVDLGNGNDTHYSDCLSMGQGFVYGFGFFYDGGGDDLYRAFWWAFGSGTHMGSGLFMEEDGNDNYFATRASAALGHDTGVSWLIDKNGNDMYGGKLSYGLSLTNGMTFFLDLNGDDTYTLPIGSDTDPNFMGFGFVNDAINNAKRVGMFLDLGGGTDTYQTANTAVSNNSQWYLKPTGAQANSTLHKGIGVDE